MILALDEWTDFGDHDKPSGMKVEVALSSVTAFMHHDNYCGQGPATYLVSCGFVRRVQPLSDAVRLAILEGDSDEIPEYLKRRRGDVR